MNSRVLLVKRAAVLKHDGYGDIVSSAEGVQDNNKRREVGAVVQS